MAKAKTTKKSKDTVKKMVAKKQAKKGSKPDFLDMDKDGNKKESMKKAIKDKKNKKIVKENTLIANFIKCVSEENYAEANKYLKQVVEAKLQAKISQAIKPTLF
jgi:hypothetical protein